MFMARRKRKKSLNAQKSGKNKIKIIHKPITPINILGYFLAAFLSTNMHAHIINKLGIVLFIKFLIYTALLNISPTRTTYSLEGTFKAYLVFYIMGVTSAYHLSDVIPEDVTF